MTITSLVKSPAATGVIGAIGTGAVGTGLGVGGWQIYEEVNPTVHRQLLSNEYTPQGPMGVPLEPEEDLSKKIKKLKHLEHRRWDCVRKLFPDVDVNYDYKKVFYTSPQISSRELSYLFSYMPSNSSSPSVIFPSTYSVEGNFVTCAMLDIRKSTSSGADSKNNIHIKSEVVAKGRDYGWVMWSTVSTTPDNRNRIHEYRFVTFRRIDNLWLQDKLYFWNRNKAVDYRVSPYPRDDFYLQVIKPKRQRWSEDSWSEGERHLYRRTWSGIGVGSADSLKGASGDSVNWVTCGQWFGVRRSYIPSVDEDMRELCYSKVSQ